MHKLTIFLTNGEHFDITYPDKPLAFVKEQANKISSQGFYSENATKCYYINQYAIVKIEIDKQQPTE